jgi:hypothetical protein
MAISTPATEAAMVENSRVALRRKMLNRSNPVWPARPHKIARPNKSKNGDNLRFAGRALPRIRGAGRWPNLTENPRGI